MAITGSTDLGDGRSLLTIDHDPSSVATDALGGSIFSDASFQLWRKLDDGSTTNVELMSGSGLGQVGASQVVSASGVLSTTSLTDIIMTSMTITPGAGTYLAIFNGTVSQLSAGQDTFVSVYANGVQNAASEVSFLPNASPASSSSIPTTTIARATVAAAQAIDVRWRVSGGTGEIRNQRSITLLTTST